MKGINEICFRWQDCGILLVYWYWQAGKKVKLGKRSFDNYPQASCDYSQIRPKILNISFK